MSLITRQNLKNYLSLEIKHVSGRELEPEERELLKEIWKFESFQLGGSSFEKLCFDVKVEIQDKAFRTGSLDITEEEVKELLNEAKKREDFEAVDYYEGLLDKIRNNDLEYKCPLFGCYETDRKTVVLYIGNIDLYGTRWTLATTFIHEMFHAYFDTKVNFNDFVEEAIVEYSTLCFARQLEDSDPKKYERLFDDCWSDVCNERTTLGLSHYGYGSYLYEYEQKELPLTFWSHTYKEVCNKGAVENDFTKEYAKMLRVYPFDREAQAMLYLHAALHVRLGNNIIDIPMPSNPLKDCRNLKEPFVLGNVLVRANVSEEEYEVPAGIERIASNAFNNETVLKRIAIGDEVKVVDCDAFEGCTLSESVKSEKTFFRYFPAKQND